MNDLFSVSIQISLKLILKGPMENKSALVQVMAWRLTGDKPLPEPRMTKSIDAYVVQSKYEKTHHKLQQKTKLPPSCRKFCVDFKNRNFTKINRVEPFQISRYLF